MPSSHSGGGGRPTRFLFYLPCIHGSFSHHMLRSSVTYHAIQDIWGQRVRILGKRINKRSESEKCMYAWVPLNNIRILHVSCVMSEAVPTYIYYIISHTRIYHKCTRRTTYLSENTSQVYVPCRSSRIHCIRILHVPCLSRSMHHIRILCTSLT